MVIAQSLDEGLQILMSTFLHRMPMIKPGIFGIGLGYQDGYLVLDLSGANSFEPDATFGLWPKDGAKDIPLRYQVERPNPLKGVDMSSMGYPISLDLYDLQSIDLTKVKVELFEGKPSRNISVQGRLICSSDINQQACLPSREFAFFPENFLKPNKKYTVVISGVESNPIESTFTTSSK